MATQRHREKHKGESEGLWLVSYADMMTLLAGFFIMLMSFSKVDNSVFEKLKRETTKHFGGEYKKPHEELVKNLQQVVTDQKLDDQVKFAQSDSGTEVSFKGSLFFNQGSIDLRREAKQLLIGLVPTILEQAKGYGVLIEGHTDNVPLRGKREVASNWELSSLRACTVLRLFEERGFDRKRLKAIGWGDTRPLETEGSARADTETLNAQNRRVVIRIVKDFAE